MMGVDGCRGGWIAATGEDGRRLEYQTIQRLSDLLAAHPEEVVGIDMSIGLLDSARPGGRRADMAARSALGSFGSSVFSAPVRRALDHRDSYDDALRASRQSSDARIGLSKQTHSLIPKIDEVDRLMRLSSR